VISGILLASGFSTRMGQEKLLLPVEGVPMIARVAQAVSESQVEEQILVYRKREIKQLIHKSITKAVHNPSAVLGQSEAIKIGLHHISGYSKCCLFFMGDQPYLNAAVINRIIAAWNHHPDKIIVPLYGDNPGSPVLFPARYYPSLMEIQGDQGGREVVKKHLDHVVFIEIDDQKAGLDADTQTAYTNLTGQKHDDNH
jgi:molybdenum cofactor cytidylyltransferase